METQGRNGLEKESESQAQRCRKAEPEKQWQPGEAPGGSKGCGLRLWPLRKAVPRQRDQPHSSLSYSNKFSADDTQGLEELSFFPNSHKVIIWTSRTTLGNVENCSSLSCCCQQCSLSSFSLGNHPKCSLQLYYTESPCIFGKLLVCLGSPREKSVRCD